MVASRKKEGICLRITVLVDNNTYIDRYYLGEPAFSCWLEDGEERILFDTGNSDILLQNAAALGIGLGGMTKLVLSHGHNDHTRGLRFLREAGLLQNAELVAHPMCLAPKRWNGEEIGSPYGAKELEQYCRKVTLAALPFALSEHITFLGEIPPCFSFEQQSTIGEVLTDAGWQPDAMREDTALSLRTEKGVYIVTGCSHSGICNIVERAKTVTGEERLAGILGGFHLMECDETLEGTVHYLEQQKPGMLCPCHCVSFAAKARLHRSIPVTEVGVGLQLTLE